MPTDAKTEAIEDLKVAMADCTIAIATDYSGLAVSEMSNLRNSLREQGLKYKVVKNTLLKIAAEQSDWPEMKELVDGPTGIIFGYSEEQIPAKAIVGFIKDSGSDIKIGSGIIGNQLLSTAQIEELSKLPGREELVGKLVTQMQGSISGLVHVLNSPLSGVTRTLNNPLAGFVNVLSGRVKQG